MLFSREELFDHLFFTCEENKFFFTECNYKSIRKVFTDVEICSW